MASTRSSAKEHEELGFMTVIDEQLAECAGCGELDEIA